MEENLVVNKCLCVRTIGLIVDIVAPWKFHGGAAIHVAKLFDILAFAFSLIKTNPGYFPQKN